MMATHKKFADNAGSDQGLRCPLTESIYIVVYVDEQRMLRSDGTDTPVDLDLRCPQIVLGPLSCVARHTSLVLVGSSPSAVKHYENVPTKMK